MQLCSKEDVKARSAVSVSDAALDALIDSVTDEIEDYVGAWLAPRPALDSDPDVTLLFDVERAGSTLRTQIGNRSLGLRALTALGVASTDQPETGGTYSTIAITSTLLRPRPTDDGPASRIVVLSPYAFSRGFNTVTATGRWGPAAVIPRVREVSIEVVLFDLAHGRDVMSERIGNWSVAYASSGRAEILSSLNSLMTPAV